MKEQIVVGTLTLSLALGFILSIEVIAHGKRVEINNHCSSLLFNAQALCAKQKINPASNTFCEEFQNLKRYPALNETNICMIGYK